ncbi:unnamed protein product [Rhizophagus irregularis]|nr:unnamed protein product [Rhizophagus irregularis]CAB5394532.1 unnamed protein product [Rhizophagus irregularis]
MPPIQLKRTRIAISFDIKKEICEYMVTNPNINQAIADGVPLTDMILQQKGLEFAKTLNIEDQLKCANGKTNSAPLETLSEERLRLHTLLAKYNKEDIYNADETGLFFEWNQIKHLVQNKTRVSILFCANATGSHKFQPFVIGKSLNSRCFKNFNKSALPVIYHANSKVWMRADIFIKWLHHLDNYFRIIDQKILLLIDNAGSHFNPKVFEETNSDLSESDKEVAELFHSA